MINYECSAITICDGKRLNDFLDLKISAEKHGVKIFPLIKEEWESLSKEKIHSLFNYIKTIDSEIILFLDAFDTFVQKDIESIVESFLSFNSSLVFGVEKNHSKQVSLYEKLNSGAFIGYKDFLLDKLNFLCEETKKHPLEKNDQVFWDDLFVSDPSGIFLDYDTRLISTALIGSIDLNSGPPLVDLYTKNTPSIIHAPGGNLYFNKCLRNSIINGKKYPFSSNAPIVFICDSENTIYSDNFSPMSYENITENFGECKSLSIEYDFLKQISENKCSIVDSKYVRNNKKFILIDSSVCGMNKDAVFIKFIVKNKDLSFEETINKKSVLTITYKNIDGNNLSLNVNMNGTKKSTYLSISE